MRGEEGGDDWPPNRAAKREPRDFVLMSTLLPKLPNIIAFCMKNVKMLGNFVPKILITDC